MTVTQGRDEGFTLIELLWVVLILSIVLSAALPHVAGPMRRMELERKARDVYMALVYSQQQAVFKGNIFGLFFDLTEGQQDVTCYRSIGYDALTGSPLMNPNNILMNPLSKRPYVITINRPGDSADICLADANFGGKNWVEFNSLGEPEPDQTGKIVLSGNNASHTITMNRLGRLAFD
jgi:prepilin-type N-terminal cleavage/methylation domain-containing protein